MKNELNRLTMTMFTMALSLVILGSSLKAEELCSYTTAREVFKKYLGTSPSRPDYQDSRHAKAEAQRLALAARERGYTHVRHRVDEVSCNWNCEFSACVRFDENLPLPKKTASSTDNAAYDISKKYGPAAVGDIKIPAKNIINNVSADQPLEAIETLTSAFDRSARLDKKTSKPMSIATREFPSIEPISYKAENGSGLETAQPPMLNKDAIKNIKKINRGGALRGFGAGLGAGSVAAVATYYAYNALPMAASATFTDSVVNSLSHAVSAYMWAAVIGVAAGVAAGYLVNKHYVNKKMSALENAK
ncbi:hypothetical protein ACFL6Y_03780 [Elusimicrobiota bacterium]